MKSIQIAGETFKILYQDLDDFGMLLFDKREIIIKKGMSAEETKRTIFHEAIHATLAMAGLNFLFESDELEEAVVRALDNIFYSVAKNILKS